MTVPATNASGDDAPPVPLPPIAGKPDDGKGGMPRVETEVKDLPITIAPTHDQPVERTNTLRLIFGEQTPLRPMATTSLPLETGTAAPFRPAEAAQSTDINMEEGNMFSPEDDVSTPCPHKRAHADEALPLPFTTMSKRDGKRPLARAVRPLQGLRTTERAQGQPAFAFNFPPATPPFAPMQLGTPHPQLSQTTRPTPPPLEYDPPSPTPQGASSGMEMEVEDGQLPGEAPHQSTQAPAPNNWQRLQEAVINGKIQGPAASPTPRSPSLHQDGGAILPDGTYVRLTNIHFPVVGPDTHETRRQNAPADCPAPSHGRRGTHPPQDDLRAQGALPPYPPAVDAPAPPANPAPAHQAPPQAAPAPPLGQPAHGAPLPPLDLDLQNLIVRHRALPGGGRLTNHPYPLPRPHEHGAVDLQPPLDILHTPEPVSGFYCVRRNHSEALMAGVPKSKVRFWDGLDPKTRMIAEIYLGKPVREGESFQATQPLKELLEEISGRTDFIIVHTEILGDHPPFDPDNMHSRSPQAVLIGNYVAELVYALIRIQTVSTPKVTANFYPADLHHDDFLGRITGFVHNIDNSIPRIITDKTLSDPIHAIIAKYVSQNPHRNHEPLEIAIQRITDSLRVSVEALPPNGQLAAFVYIDTPADTMDGDESWCKEMNAIKWDSVDNGTGIMWPVGPCRGCNSSEHSAHHCRLPDTPGWFGPIPPEKANPERGVAAARGLDTRERGRGRGRGFRGRF